jgi:hypothetical protein
MNKRTTLLHWWNNHTTEEMRQDIKAYHSIDYDWFDYRLNDSQKSYITEQTYLEIKSFVCPPTDKYMKFRVTLLTEKNGSLIFTDFVYGKRSEKEVRKWSRPKQ